MGGKTFTPTPLARAPATMYVDDDTISTYRVGTISKTSANVPSACSIVLRLGAIRSRSTDCRFLPLVRSAILSDKNPRILLASSSDSMKSNAEARCAQNVRRRANRLVLRCLRRGGPFGLGEELSAKVSRQVGRKKIPPLLIQVEAIRVIAST